MNHPLTVSALARSVWHDFLVARRELFIFEILFKLLEAWLLVPALAMVLAIIMSRAAALSCAWTGSTCLPMTHPSHHFSHRKSSDETQLPY
jgi:hypothetical protein